MTEMGLLRVFFQFLCVALPALSRQRFRMGGRASPLLHTKDSGVLYI